MKKITISLCLIISLTVSSFGTALGSQHQASVDGNVISGQLSQALHNNDPIEVTVALKSSGPFTKKTREEILDFLDSALAQINHTIEGYTVALRKEKKAMYNQMKSMLMDLIVGAGIAGAGGLAFSKGERLSNEYMAVIGVTTGLHGLYAWYKINERTRTGKFQRKLRALNRQYTETIAIGKMINNHPTV